MKRRRTRVIDDVQTRYGRARMLATGYGSNNALAIVLDSPRDGPVGTLSTNMDHGQPGLQSHQLPEGCFYAREWGGGEDLAADCMASGWFELVPELPPIESGYVLARVWRLRTVRGAPVHYEAPAGAAS